MENHQSVAFRDQVGRGDVSAQLGGRFSGRWKLLLAGFVIHLFVNGFNLSYGIYIVSFVEYGIPAWLGFITQVSFAVSYTIAQTWCREITDSWSGNIGYRFMAITGLLMLFFGMVLSAFTPHYLYPLNIGLFGGVGVCILLTQVDTILSECFETHLAMARAFCYIAQAASQIFVPQLVLLMVQTYGAKMTIFVHSAIVLQTLLAILYLKTDFLPRRPRPVSRYSDLSRINSFFNEHYNRNDLQLVELNSKSWRSPSDGSLHKLQDNDLLENLSKEENELSTVTPPPSPDERRKNLFGVEILPEIPEESEMSYSSDSDSDVKKLRNRFSSDIKRLSVMSDKLDELILRNDKCASCSLGHYETGVIKDINSVNNNAESASNNLEVTCYHLSPNYDVTREFKSFHPQSNYRILGYFRKPVRLKRRITYCAYCINDTLFKPFGISLSFWRFYPALFLKLTSIVVPIGVVNLLPLFSVQLVKTSIKEATLLLTVYGFAWACLLITTPWITSMSKIYLKFVFVGGSFVSLAGLFILADTNSYAFVIVSSVLLGLGQGTVLLTSEDTLREWIGLRKWSKVRGTLEFLSSIGVAIIGSSMAYELTAIKGVKYCFEILTLLQAVIAFIWFLISISNIYFRKSNRSYDINPMPC